MRVREAHFALSEILPIFAAAIKFSQYDRQKHDIKLISHLYP